MEEILKSSRKVVIDRAAEGQSGVVPFLPLPELLQQPGAPAPGASAPSQSPAVPPVTGSAPPAAGRRR
jgi:hypothetical protein